MTTKTQESTMTDVDIELFAGVDEVKMGVPRLPKLTAGEYTVKLDRTTTVKSSNPKTKGQTFAIAEGTVLTASEGSLSSPGTTASISLSSGSPAFDKNAKSLVMAATGAPAAKVDKKVVAAFFSSSSQKDIKGATFRVRVESATSKAGNNYLKYTFMPVSN